MKNYKYISPLICVEPSCESEKYANLKTQISNYLQEEKNTGQLTYASVYVKNLANNDWFVINPSQGYHPGSLCKVPVMLTYLRMADSNSKLLDWTINYEKDPMRYPPINYKADTIALGHSYNVRQLLHHMVSESDNRATNLLETFMDKKEFDRCLTDFGLKPISFSDTSYRFNVVDYSLFLKAIYNVTYLSIPESEYAAKLLSESSYNDGLVKLLPPGIKVARKFGEWSDDINNELHESGIVYLEGSPYLITVMTRGRSWDKQKEVTNQISKMVYDEMSKPGGM